MLHSADAPSEVKAQTLADLKAVRALLVDTFEKYPGEGTHRWGKNSYKCWDCYCLSGAIGSVCASNPLDDCSHPRGDNVMRALGFLSNLEMILWNDQPSRTFPEVVARIDAAIAVLS